MTLNAAQKDNLKLLQTTLIKALNQQIEEIRESDIYESTISHQFCDEVTIRACSNRNLEYIEKKTGDGKAARAQAP